MSVYRGQALKQGAFCFFHQHEMSTAEKNYKILN